MKDKNEVIEIFEKARNNSKGNGFKIITAFENYLDVKTYWDGITKKEKDDFIEELERQYNIIDK